MIISLALKLKEKNIIESKRTQGLCKIVDPVPYDDCPFTSIQRIQKKKSTKKRRT